MLINVIKKWSDKKINGRYFNDEFEIDGIPIWWFLEPFLRQPYIPKPFKSLDEIKDNDIGNDKILSYKNNFQFYILRKGLIINEKIKFLISKFRKKEINKRDVLFLVYTNHIVIDNGIKFIHYNEILKNLEKKKIKPLVLILDPLSKNSLFNLLQYENLLYDHITYEILKESKKKAKELNQKWRRLDEKIKEKLFTFQGKKYWKLLKNEINFLFSEEILFILIKYYLTFKNIIEKYKISVIYINSLIGFYEIPLLLSTCKLNKKVIYSPHGYGDRYFIIRKEVLKNVLFAAISNEHKKRLLKLGIKSKNIVIVGSPLFDKIINYKKRKIKKKGVITLLTQPLIEDKYIEKGEYFNYVKKLLNQISRINNIKKILLKLHPREKFRSKLPKVKTLGV